MSRGAPNQPPRVLAEGRYLTLVDEAGWEYVTRRGVTGIVVIVAITDDGKLVLVEQHRTAVHGRVIELPAGLVGDGAAHAGEALTDAAARELVEETGYAAREMVPLAACAARGLAVDPKLYAGLYLVDADGGRAR